MESGFSGTVLIADDHEVYRFGLSRLLHTSLGAERVLEADRFEVALECLDATDLKLAIFDLTMPGLDSPHDLAKVRQARPDVTLVALTASDCREDMLAVLAAGAHGYILKSESSDLLLERLQHVLAGEVYVPASLTHLAPAPERDPTGLRNNIEVTSRLTERQVQVLRCLLAGKSNKEIGRELSLSSSTVKQHLVAIFRALGAQNRAHAAALARQLLD
jgi:DNA-binding NarL/FixJ family response regulator